MYKAMMNNQEIEIIESLLKPEFDCLEFGAGYSTLYFSKMVNSWTSIEHDVDWFLKVTSNQNYNKKNTDIIFASPPDYLEAASLLDKEFDFILVDGILRKQCFDLSFKLLKKGGIVLVHDASRFEYKDWINSRPGEVLSEGEIPDQNNINYFLHRGLKLCRHL